MPENFFNAETGEVKGADLRAHLDELATFKAAEDVRKLSLPATAEAYEAKLPEGFQFPAGQEFEFKADDPALVQARTMAHAKGWSQQDFSEALGVFAGVKAQEAAQYETLKTQNLAALGANAPQRVDAVTRWLSANFDEATVKPVLSTLATSKHVEMFEKIIGRLTSQGSANFTQRHRDIDTGKVDQAAWDKMSYSDKKAYTAKHSGQAA